jgi:hypothetical protein
MALFKQTACTKNIVNSDFSGFCSRSFFSHDGLRT